MLKNSIIISLLLSTLACATPTITEIHLKPQFNENLNTLKEFEPLSVYQFNNSAQYPWLYELSGLAWDYDDKVLYSITDGGYLIILKPSIENNKISNVEIQAHYKLIDINGNPITGKFSDSEGLALRNHNNGKQRDTELLISFERSPRIDLYTNKGVFLEHIVNFNRQFKNHEFSSLNKQLESITEWGDNFIFGSERPFKNSKPGEIYLFNTKKQIGTFHLKDKQYGSLVGLTSKPNQVLIALERVFVNVFTPLKFHIHKIEYRNNIIQQKTLYSSEKKYEYFYDNFEGITHHLDNNFFMVSDDNQNALQRTLLIYFRLTDQN